jgi:hypothetical protein
MPDQVFHLTNKQTAAYRLLTDSSDAAVLFGGAKGGGKSFFLSCWLLAWCKHLVQLFNLSPSANPLPVGFIGRKQSVDFNRTTLETFKRVIPAQHYELREQDQEIIFWNRVKVFYGGLDNQDRIRKFNSAEFAFFALDQAEETERTDVDVLMASLRLKHNGIQPAYKQLYTANPADCWLKEDFIDNLQPRCHYIPALYTENPHLPSSYGDILTQAFRYNEAVLRAYKDGDWYALEASTSLISSRMLNELKEIHHLPLDIRRIIACDPSLGGDECVIYAMENGAITEQLILHERDTMKIVGHIIAMSARLRIPNFAIDTIGIGQGITDRLRELRPSANVNGINSAESARDEERFANRRAEMWFTVMKRIQDHAIPYPMDEELRNQLTAMRFKIVNSNGKVQLEPKVDTKKRIGRSPDRADAFVMGLWAIGYTDPIQVGAFNKEDYVSEPINRLTSYMAA